MRSPSRSTRCGCSRSPGSTTATSRTAPFAPRAPRSSRSRCSAPPACSGARCGGHRSIGTTTRTPTTPDDAHSAHQHGFFWSHVGWFLARESFATRRRLVPDLARFPELRFLDRFDLVVPLALAAILYGAGRMARRRAPELATERAAARRLGLLRLDGRALPRDVHDEFARAPVRLASLRDAATTRATTCWLALLTFGEGWHNNHHHFPGSARQGFYWWEIDLTYYGLRLLARARRHPGPARPARRHLATRAQVAHEDRDRRQRHRRQRRCRAPAAREHDVTVFEAGAHVGGHTHTHTSSRTGAAIASTPASSCSTTGPTRTSSRCWTSSASPRRPSSMSFCVRDEASGLEYNGSSLNALFAQRRNLLRPSFWRMLARHPALQPRGARAALGHAGRSVPGRLPRRKPLFADVHRALHPGRWARRSGRPIRRGCSRSRRASSSASCTTTACSRWTGGRSGARSGAAPRATSRSWSRRFRDRIRLNTTVESIRRLAGRVIVKPRGHEAERFDAVFIACHSDQALRCSPMPRRRSARSSARSATSATRSSCIPTRDCCRAPPRLGGVELPHPGRRSRPGRADLQHEHPAVAGLAPSVPGDAQSRRARSTRTG